MDSDNPQEERKRRRIGVAIHLALASLALVVTPIAVAITLRETVVAGEVLPPLELFLMVAIWLLCFRLILAYVVGWAAAKNPKLAAWARATIRVWHGTGWVAVALVLLGLVLLVAYLAIGLAAWLVT